MLIAVAQTAPQQISSTHPLLNPTWRSHPRKHYSQMVPNSIGTFYFAVERPLRVGATRRLLNFLLPAYGAGKLEFGGGWRPASRSRNADFPGKSR